MNIFSKPTPNWGKGVDPRLHLFRNFLRLVWAHLGLPEPTPVQLDIADWLQFGPKRLITEAFRGVGKSYITSAFVAWCLLMDPDMAILVVSASKTRADDFTTFVLRLIFEMELLQHLQPRGDQRCSKVSFDVGPATAKHSPSVKSVGITSQLAGSRADLIVADDVEVPNNSGTQMMREKLAESVKEFDAILKPGGRVVYLGTPQTEQSLYNALPSRGYVTRVWSARFPTPEQLRIYGANLAPFLVAQIEAGTARAGSSTDPKRFSDADLVERELSYGRSGFALQFMLDTRLSDADRYPLKLADLITDDLDSESAPERLFWSSHVDYVQSDLPNVGFNGDRWYGPMDYQRDDKGLVRRQKYDAVCMFVDPSGRGKDETGWAVVALLNSQVFALDWGGIRTGYDDAALTLLAEKAKEWKVSLILVEPNFGDGMFNQLLAPYLNRIYPCTVEDSERAMTQKEKRIVDSLEPVMNQHRLVFNRRAIKRDYESTQDLPPEEALKYQLVYQLTRLTKDKGALAHDDRLEALAIGVKYFVEQMSQDLNDTVKARTAELLDEELARFMEHALGAQPPKSSSIIQRW
ncbi:MAG: phage terminase large subunit [Phenylobacterium sp.]